MAVNIPTISQYSLAVGTHQSGCSSGSGLSSSNINKLIKIGSVKESWFWAYRIEGKDTGSCRWWQRKGPRCV